MYHIIIEGKEFLIVAKSYNKAYSYALSVHKKNSEKSLEIPKKILTFTSLSN